MISKTKNYDQFKFREDNRVKIDPLHVERLVKSIQARNLLHLRPIVVNAQMEVMDGQNRLLAAKKLGVDIYYEVNQGLTCSDIILLNVTKAWSTADYLNFYVKNGYEQYIKLNEFIKRQQIGLKIALSLSIGASDNQISNFREGKYIFNLSNIEPTLDICRQTIDYIKKMNGFSSYTDSGKFWKSLVKLVTCQDFDQKKWFFNRERYVSHFCPKARIDDYLKVMMDTYNYRNNHKVDLYG